MLTKKIESPFRIRTAADETWHEMTLPGSAMDVYVRDGVLPDPYIGTNEYRVRDFFWNDFVIEGTFNVTAEEAGKEHVQLVFEGIDTIADLYVNGEKIGHVSDMHRTYRFEVRDLVREGENELRVEILSPLKFVRDFVPEEGCESRFDATGAVQGFRFIRKAASMYGWDWGAQLPDAGIWRPVRLEVYDGCRLGATRVHQVHQGTCCRLEFFTEIEEDSEKAAGKSAGSPYLAYRVASPDGALLYEGPSSCVEIQKPHLWWPHGYGEQPLYRVTVTLHGPDGDQEDSFRIGLRTLTVSRDRDEWGEEFCFVVNGRKIFAMGANYIPQDCFYTHVTDEILERDIRAASFANYNCLRIWGGGYYQADRFYELCDEYGILVWQDLLFACSAYELYPQFEEDVLCETRDNLRRIRNHPCLALLCGNNEMEAEWMDDGMGHESLRLRKDYLVLFEYLLPRIARQEAPDVFWWPSTPSSGGCFEDPNDEERGDVHFWAVWHGLLPMEAYEEHSFRFLSEFGFQSLPDKKTVRSFAGEGDRNLFSEVMESHQKNPAANGKIMSYLSDNFRYPKDLDSIGYLSQVLQGIAMKTAVDHLRRHRGRCMGALYWQFNDNWPVLSWSSMDYYGRFKVLHYMARRFYGPVAGSITYEALDSPGRSFWLCNETSSAWKAEVTMALKTLDFAVLQEKKTVCRAEPFSSIMAVKEDYGSILEEDGEELSEEYRGRLLHYPVPPTKAMKGTFVCASWRAVSETTGEVREGSEYSLFVRHKYLELRDPGIEVSVSENGDVTLRGKSFAPLVMAENEDHDTIWDDNAVTLTDSLPVTLHRCGGEYRCGDHISLQDVWHTYQ